MVGITGMVSCDLHKKISETGRLIIVSNKLAVIPYLIDYD